MKRVPNDELKPPYQHLQTESKNSSSFLRILQKRRVISFQKVPLSGVISRKFVWICLTKLERRDISQIFYFSMENFFYFGETCLQLIALGVIGVKCEFDKKTRKELPDTFL